MKSKKQIIRNLLFVLVCCGLLIKCDSQSGEVIYTDAFSVALYNLDPDKFYDWQADAWRTGEYPDYDDDIYSVAGGYLLQLKSDGEDFRQENIRVDVKVSDYGYIPDSGATESLWDDMGFITVWPQAGMKIDGDGTVHGRTSENGQLLIFPGLGDPDIFSEDWTPDSDYIWPDFVATWVELEIKISRRNQPLRTVYVWALFMRVQYQHFWGSSGVIKWCEFGTGRWMKGSSSRIDKGQALMNTSAEPIALALSEVLPVKPAKGKQTDYSIPSTLSEKKIIQTMNDSSSSGTTINWAEWDQLVYVYEYGGWNWASIYGMPVEWHGMWFDLVDPNDPNEIRTVLDQSQPYAFRADITLSQASEPHVTTMILKSVNASTGNTISQMLVPIYPVDNTPDKIRHLVCSSWVLLVDDPNEQGYYFDSWNNLYTVIYAPSGSFIKLKESNADFNLNGIINLQDFALFSEHWQEDSMDTNSSYDAYFEDPNNPNGLIDLWDLLWFSGKWLTDPNESEPIDPNST